MFQFERGGRLPALDRDAAHVITGSEHILKAYANKHSLTATAIVDLIKIVLKNPDFNADDVDTDMLQSLQAAIDSCDLQFINMHKDGDGQQVLELFAWPVEKVLCELIGGLCLASHQHFAFREYKDPHGNRLFAGDANGEVSFQLAQIKIGNNKVPVSIVLYIDGKFLKKGIPIRSVYISIVPSIICYIVYDIVCIYFDIVYDICYLIPISYTISYTILDVEAIRSCSMESDSVLAVGCLNNERSFLAKSNAWRPVALLPILKGSACAETNNDWVHHRRT
jgi:hypothetical protein